MVDKRMQRCSYIREEMLSTVLGLKFNMANNSLDFATYVYQAKQFLEFMLHMMDLYWN